jgi:hypothetical protein
MYTPRAIAASHGCHRPLCGAAVRASALSGLDIEKHPPMTGRYEDQAPRLPWPALFVRETRMTCSNVYIEVRDAARH